jgi:hypothetical protein
MLVGHTVIEQHAHGLGFPRGTFDRRLAPRRQRRAIISAQETRFQHGKRHHLLLFWAMNFLAILSLADALLMIDRRSTATAI